MRGIVRRSIWRAWRELDLGLPPFIRQLLIEPTKRALLPLAMPYRRLRRLRGRNEAGPLRLSSFARFERELIFVRKCFFTESTLEKTAVRVPFWRIPQTADPEESDLILIRGGKSLIDRLPRRRSLVMPARVEVVLDVRGSWDEITRRFRKSAKESLRVTRRKDFSYRVSRNQADLEEFFHRMYVPTIRARHGELANPIHEQAASVFLKRGLLFFLRENGRDVAGSLCRHEGKTLRLVADGLADGDLGLMRAGTLAASFIHRFRWAKDQGYESVSFMSAPPCLSDRVLRSKRRWGSFVRMGPGIQSHLWLQLQRLTPAVERCLEDNPFIVFDRQGDMVGLVIVRNPENLDEADKRKLHKAHATPGLKRLLACSADSLMNDPQPLEHAVSL